MKQLIFIFLLIYCTATNAAVTMQLNTSTVQLGQSFQLTLRMDNLQSGNIPDLTFLQNDFNIVGTQRSSNYSIINGQVSASSQWIITLMPKRAGVLTIPAIKIGQQYSNAANITVTTTATNNANSPTNDDDNTPDEGINLSAEVSDKNPFVNQQVIYTIRLYNSYRLINANYQGPHVENALMITLGNSQHYQTYKNGRTYAVEQQQYAIFPQKSGSLKISPPKFSALIYDDEAKQIQVNANPTLLKVKAAPVKGKEWLPAKEVQLSEKYDRNTNTLTQGSTLVRTVTLQVTGLPAQLLPNLTFSDNGEFSVYPEKPTNKNTFRQTDLEGKTTVNVTYLLNKPGQIVIPSLKLPWFNIVTKKEEIALLPETIINVVSIDNQGNSVNKIKTMPAKQLPGTNEPNELQTVQLPMPSKQNLIAWWVAGGFALAWLITLLMWWQRRHPRSKTSGKTQILKELHQACFTHQPELAKTALLAWASYQWPDTSILNLMDINKLISDKVLKGQINQLSDALYHPDKPFWHGDDLWQCIKKFKRNNEGKSTKDKPLPPINPG